MERQAFRLLAEADAIYEQLVGLFLAQPDLPKREDEGLLSKVKARGN